MRLDSNKQLVRDFYRVLWDEHDLARMPGILVGDFVFRGSLGAERRGHAGFGEYVDMVHAALADYRCTVEQLVAEDDKVFAKMLFGGIHRAPFLGWAPTGRRVEWRGCALFTIAGDRIAELWVLGDLKALEMQLAANKASAPR